MGIEIRWKVYWGDRPLPADVAPQEGRRNSWSAVVVESHVLQ
jgi:hypothetical protein